MARSLPESRVWKAVRCIPSFLRPPACMALFSLIMRGGGGGGHCSVPLLGKAGGVVQRGVSPFHRAPTPPNHAGLRVLGAALTDEQLAARLETAGKEVAALRSRLQQLQATVTRPVAPHAREELVKKIAKFKVRSG